MTDRSIVDADTRSECARTDWSNPMPRGGWPIDSPLPLVAYSGWHDAEPSAGGVSADDDDPSSRAIRARLRTWNAGGDAFRALSDEAGRTLPSGAIIALRPRVGHALSDVPTCARFLRERAGGPWRLLLDPVGMLSRGMLADADDHLRRIMDALGTHPGVLATLLTNAEPGEQESLAACAVHRGVISPKVLREAAERSASPVVLLDVEVQEQRRVLGESR